MLRVVTITVEEATAEAAVDALDKYERALHTTEGDRYDLHDDDDPVSWSDRRDVGRLDDQVGRDLIYDNVHFESSGPNYVGTRTFAFRRVDKRG